MLYKEVPPSSVLPGSTFDPGISYDQIEKMFDRYIYEKGPKYYQAFRSSNFQSTNTFLKDVIVNLIKFSDNNQLTEQQKFQLSLISDSIKNLLGLVEDIMNKTDQEQYNAIICGTLLKHLKNFFS